MNVLFFIIIWLSIACAGLLCRILWIENKKAKKIIENLLLVMQTKESQEAGSYTLSDQIATEDRSKVKIVAYDFIRPS